MKLKVCAFFMFFMMVQLAVGQKKLDNYIFFNRDRERIHDTAFLNNPNVKGALLKYAWRELEPNMNSYDFKDIEEDLAFLKSKGKELFIQIQERSFDTTILNLPEYLLTDALYNGGAFIQYEFLNKEETKFRVDGWVAKRWDSQVAKRFDKLLIELGNTFDGRIEGLILPETAIGVGDDKSKWPKGYYPSNYFHAITKSMKTAKKVFPKSVIIQYANFFPGEWMPESKSSYLHRIFQTAKVYGVGVGGPDVFPYKPSQMKNSYNLIRDCAKSIPTGMAVQQGNCDYINPQTNKRVKISEIYIFASEFMNLDYLFWGTQEPYYSNNILPFIRKIEKQ
ncbi:MAG: hypothetical protein ACEPOW_09135 [Bacteroidales bacterium]